MNAIFKRVSVREFTDKPVEAAKANALLRAALAAPSAGHQQPWEFYVVTEPSVIARLGEATKYSKPAGAAPLVIVPCKRNNGMRHEAFVDQDMSAAVENILLEAVEQCLGAVWMGVAPKEGRMEIVRNILNIPANLDAFALVAVGYPAEQASQKDRFDASRIHEITPAKEPYTVDAEAIAGTFAARVLGME